MDIRVQEVQKLSRAVALLASLDQSQFTKEQRDIVTEAVQAVAIAEEYRKSSAKRNRDFLRKKREEDPTYNVPEWKPTGRKPGRPRKEA